MKRSLSILAVFVATFAAFLTHAFASEGRLPDREMEKIEKSAVLLNYWGLDGPNRSEDRLFLQRPWVSKNHRAVPLSREDFLRKLNTLEVKRDTILITMAVSINPIPEPSLDEAVRFFRRSGFHRVMIVLGEGQAPTGYSSLILRDTAARH